MSWMQYFQNAAESFIYKYENIVYCAMSLLIQYLSSHIISFRES